MSRRLPSQAALNCAQFSYDAMNLIPANAAWGSYSNSWAGVRAGCGRAYPVVLPGRSAFTSATV